MPALILLPNEIAIAADLGLQDKITYDNNVRILILPEADMSAFLDIIRECKAQAQSDITCQ